MRKIKIVEVTKIIYTNSMGEEKYIEDLDKNHLLNSFAELTSRKALGSICDDEDLKYIKEEIIRRLSIADTK